MGRFVRLAAKKDFALPDLPYAFDALTPVLDAKTMRVHHGKHHQAYVDKLNEALDKHLELRKMSLEELLSGLKSLPADVREEIRNNGGGHYNHSQYWRAMSPEGGGKPEGKLLKAINESFSSFDDFKTFFVDAGKKRFGSGWVWLVQMADGSLKIISTPNQDNPLMSGQGTPLFGVDVWEHAYYLKYQNKRDDYLAAWFDVANWPEIAKKLKS